MANPKSAGLCNKPLDGRALPVHALIIAAFSRQYDRQAMLDDRVDDLLTVEFAHADRDQSTSVHVRLSRAVLMPQHAPQQPARSREPDISNEPEPDITKKL